MAGPFRFDPRPLTSAEAALTRWLLEHGSAEAAKYAHQVARARVVSHCPCGCASVDFAVDGVIPPPEAKMEILADFIWGDELTECFGIFVFARADRLAGLEVWTAGEGGGPTELPDVGQLRPMKASRV